ncbi:hypothetical protein C4B60_19440 [Jeotgalibacillus proteolyticus]|uniref:Uncharacterized protein n=1 Tax=Jeotgalibacillus proteolyticus TaxID=2082395 RepID=A0A2S5G6Y9_9BACL|nr:hypothetical protein C4B60_19440 [Jeotgalibacillus proteolyticus]
MTARLGLFVCSRKGSGVLPARNVEPLLRLTIRKAKGQMFFNSSLQAAFRLGLKRCIDAFRLVGDGPKAKGSGTYGL